MSGGRGRSKKRELHDRLWTVSSLGMPVPAMTVGAGVLGPWGLCSCQAKTAHPQRPARFFSTSASISTLNGQAGTLSSIGRDDMFSCAKFFPPAFCIASFHGRQAKPKGRKAKAHDVIGPSCRWPAPRACMRTFEPNFVPGPSSTRHQHVPADVRKIPQRRASLRHRAKPVSRRRLTRQDLRTVKSSSTAHIPSMLRVPPGSVHRE
jgi:hypothetical protein